MHRFNIVAGIFIGLIVAVCIIVFVFNGSLPKKISFSKLFKHVAKIAPMRDIFVNMNEITMNLSDTTAAHYLKVTMTLAVSGQGAPDKIIEEQKPKILDSLIIVTTKFSYFNLLTMAGKQELKKELQEEFNKTLRPSGVLVRDVLFTDFVME